MGKLDPTRFISKRFLGRKPSAIRQIVNDNHGTPGMLSLAGGLPNPQVFPFKGLTATLADGSVMEVNHRDVEGALQYSASAGWPHLVSRLKGMQQRYHAPPLPFDLAVGTGSQSLLSIAFDMLLNPGDPLLVEAPTYPGALAALQPLKPSFVPVATDEHGLVPAALQTLLEGWDTTGGPKPKVLYCIPTGQNPSGATIPADRRREIYRLAQEHDLVILEDDPYYYLYLDGSPPPSLFSMDVDGRVLRFDSLSKVLSSGMRLGFVTGTPALVAPIVQDVSATSLHTSGVSQVLASTLLERWGDQGWEQHVDSVKAFYRQRRDTFVACCEKHLAGLADWARPEAGMFLWFHFRNVSDTMDLISHKAKEEKVLLVPGQAFFTDGKPSKCCRAAYSLASDEDMDEALRRLATLLRNNADK